MSNETPVTLTDCIEWLLSCQFESAHKINLKNKDAQAYISAILSHLRASAAKLPEGFVDISEHIAEMCKDPEYAARHLAARERLRAAPGEAKCENDELRKQVAALSKIDEQGMGHDDALSAIAGHVHEIKVLCDAFGYDPSQWLQDEAANGIDCAPSPEQQDKALEWTIHSKYALVAPEQQGAEQYPLNYMQTALAEGSESGMCWISAQVCESVIESLRTAPAPALGLTQDEREAIEAARDSLCNSMLWEMRAADNTFDQVTRNKHLLQAQTYTAAGVTLRSLLERGGV
jgi:hypothetical protein